jgi:O-antigen/teichoic acid export membrane protein
MPGLSLLAPQWLAPKEQGPNFTNKRTQELTTLQLPQRQSDETESASAGITQDPEDGREMAAIAAVPGNIEPSALQRAIRGVGWNVFGSIVAQGGTFLSSVLVARLIGKHQFGQFAMIQSTVTTLTGLAALGLGITATKYVSQYRTTNPERAGRILGLSSMVAVLAALCFCAGLVVFAPSLATDGALVPDLRLSAIYVFFITLNGYQVGALVGLEAFKKIAGISLVSGPATVLLTWALAYRFGIRGAVLAQGVSAFILWLFYHIALTFEGRATNIAVRYRGVWKERSALIRFSVPAMLSGIIGSFAIWWCNIILVRTNGYAELAVFTAANNLRLMVVFLPALIARVTAPMLNSLLVSGNHVDYRRTFRGAIAVNGGIALLLALLLWGTNKQILHLFGKDFVGSTALVVLLLGSVVVEVVAVNLCQALFTSQSLWWQVAIITIWSALLAGASTFTIPRYGAAGLACSYLVAWCVSGVLYGSFAWVQQKRRDEGLRS